MMKLGLIGLDTSHSIKFTEVINGDGGQYPGFNGLQVVTCLRFPSPFQSEPDQDQRQRRLEALGVSVTRNFDAAVAGVDGLLIEINDPAQHLAYMHRAVALGLPVFLDKPPAANLAEAREIARLVQAAGIPCWSSSSLRFGQEFQAACARVPQPVLINIHAALGTAAAGSSVVWYGVHGVEMVVAAMGRGAQQVRAFDDGLGVIAWIGYANKRRALLELNRGRSVYGGLLEQAQTLAAFQADNAHIYDGLLAALRDFFLAGTIPVPFDETLEVQAILDAIDESLPHGKTVAINPQEVQA